MIYCPVCEHVLAVTGWIALKCTDCRESECQHVWTGISRQGNPVVGISRCAGCGTVYR